MNFIQRLFSQIIVGVIVVAPTIVFAEPAKPATAPASGPSRIDLPSFGISVPVPAGYTRDADGSTVVVFIPKGQVGRTPDSVVMVIVIPSNRQSVSDVVAEGLQQGILSAPSPVHWGGREAQELRSTHPLTLGKVDTARMMLLEKDGQVYELALLAQPGHENDLVGYDELANGTTWLPVAHAGAGLARGGPYLHLPNDLGVIVPDPFRPDMGSKSKSIAPFIAEDLLTQTRVAKLLIIPMPSDRGDYTPASAREMLEKNLAPTWQLDAPLKWTEESGKLSIETSNLVSNKEGRMQAMIVVTPQKTVTFFTLQLFRSDETARGLEDTLSVLKKSLAVLEKK